MTDASKDVPEKPVSFFKKYAWAFLIPFILVIFLVGVLIYLDQRNAAQTPFIYMNQ